MLWCGLQTKCHALALPQPILSYLSQVGLGVLHNRKVVKARLYVQDAPARGLPRFIQDLGRFLEGVLEVFSVRVKVHKVAAHAVVLARLALLHQDYIACALTCGHPFHDSRLFQFFHFPLYPCSPIWR